MLRLLIILMIAITYGSQAGVVYKKVMPDGSVKYSDKPFLGSKPVLIKDRSTRNNKKQTVSRSLSTSKSLIDDKEKTKSKVRPAITINSPAHGDTIRDNNGNFTIVVQPTIDKKAQYKIQLFLNNKPHGKPSQSTVYNIKNHDRGEVKIKAQLQSSSGQILATSKEAIIYLHRVSVIKAK
ncbi:hypothetical protein [Psychrobium sp. 1_MG-2023]|uniref:hypothetical protein n=1 Tax=Psychrobium sp. 1_MG-2023 TaxID=3062624 RepID=UPI000C32D538|nr:hypothetical protein [Psychrobium sp. 1_MG-2023]MDP2561041.1 hypothetical protein [Psychrobium sp. 1_MG-2023]PKF58333.1 hypothetical protein CW748_04010 [Alteromonadales bacterium alter-6D02]